MLPFMGSLTIQVDVGIRLSRNMITCARKREAPCSAPLSRER